MAERNQNPKQLREYDLPADAQVYFRNPDAFKRVVPFTAILYADAASAALAVDTAKTGAPVGVLRCDPWFAKFGVILEIAYRLNPTDAVTYTLMLFEGTASQAYAINSKMLYESAAGKADDTDYVVQDRQIVFNLDNLGQLYYSIDWSAAPGNTTGYIRVSGVCYL